MLLARFTDFLPSSHSPFLSWRGAAWFLGRQGRNRCGRAVPVGGFYCCADRPARAAAEKQSNPISTACPQLSRSLPWAERSHSFPADVRRLPPWLPCCEAVCSAAASFPTADSAGEGSARWD